MQWHTRTVAAPEGPRFRVRAVVAGLVLSLVVTVLAAGIIAVVLLSSPLTEKHLPWVINGFGFLSIFCGGFASARISGSLGWFHGCLTGLGYVLVAYLLSTLAFAPAPPVTLARVLFAALAGTVGGMLGVNY
ncbi:MAG: TIGR04086 family membrane protein [Bacillota bacterium]